MLRDCDVCGREYSAKRASSKYCSETCRKRAQRAPLSVVHGESRPSESTASVTRIFAATEAELSAVGMVESSLGQKALMLALRLDSTTMDTGSSVAAVAREHGATLQAAIDAGNKTGDEVDDLKLARDRRRA